MNKQYDSRTADKFVVRLPDGLRAQIAGVFARTGIVGNLRRSRFS